ncbi:MAG: transglutaminase family protein [Mesorhizobium sp.]
MRLKIVHKTEYRYDQPLSYALQRARLVPASGKAQTVENWSIAFEGAKEELSYIDGFGNDTRLISLDGEPRQISIIASGEVETHATAGVSGPQRGFMPLWMFKSPTPLTMPGTRAAQIAQDVGEGKDLDRLHRLLGLVSGRVAYVTGVTNALTTAEEALEQGQGVCQDHAHIFATAARLCGFPARYASGYLMLEGEQVASHAWAEAHVDGLGWVGFDPSNNRSPDETYVSLATGRDYRDAAPLSGIRHGPSSETLAVQITVEQ